jgi:hypothetical protein
MDKHTRIRLVIVSWSLLILVLYAKKFPNVYPPLRIANPGL